jgi:hypothetical protein
MSKEFIPTIIFFVLTLIGFVMVFLCGERLPLVIGGAVLMWISIAGIFLTAPK